MARLNGIIAALEKGQTAFGTFAPADVESALRNRESVRERRFAPPAEVTRD